MPKRLDLTGNIYGELTVIEMLYNYNNKSHTYCRCIGTNGDEVIVRADALQSGATHSMKGAGKAGKPLDISGQKFGLLTVLRPTHKRANNNSIIWECLCDCGNHTEVACGNLVRGHTLSCGCRHRSKWEVFIHDFLVSLDVEFVEEKRFNGCKNKKGSDVLPFDFYLPQFNLLIEYDGLHHFEPVNGWGGEEKFNITKENDEIKNNFCKLNNINLLRLSYMNTEDDIKNEILNILSPVTITV